MLITSGRKIAALRAQTKDANGKKLSIQRAAKGAGIPKFAFAHLEREHMSLSKHTQAVADFFNVPLADVTEEVETKHLFCEHCNSRLPNPLNQQIRKEIIEEAKKVTAVNRTVGTPKKKKPIEIKKPKLPELVEKTFPDYAKEITYKGLVHKNMPNC